MELPATINNKIMITTIYHRFELYGIGSSHIQMCELDKTGEKARFR